MALIKKTKSLSTLSLVELISVIKACDVDDRHRALNHTSSYNTPGVGSSNTAFVSQPRVGAYPLSPAYQTPPTAQAPNYFSPP